QIPGFGSTVWHKAGSGLHDGRVTNSETPAKDPEESRPWPATLTPGPSPIRTPAPPGEGGVVTIKVSAIRLRISCRLEADAQPKERQWMGEQPHGLTPPLPAV